MWVRWERPFQILIHSPLVPGETSSPVTNKAKRWEKPDAPCSVKSNNWKILLSLSWSMRRFTVSCNSGCWAARTNIWGRCQGLSGTHNRLCQRKMGQNKDAIAQCNPCAGDESQEERQWARTHTNTQRLTMNSCLQHVQFRLLEVDTLTLNIWMHMYVCSYLYLICFVYIFFFCMHIRNYNIAKYKKTHFHQHFQSQPQA